MTTIFDGRSFSQQKEKLLKEKIFLVSNKLGRKPKLVAMGIGKEKDIELYIRMKEKVAERVSIEFEKKIFQKDSSENEVLTYVSDRNNDTKVDGILLELPLPQKFSVTKIVEQISPEKDPDGMTYENLGRIMYGKPRVLPATVRAIKEILKYYYSSSGARSQNDSSRPTASNNKPLAYKNALVIGGGIELGKPLTMWLSDMGAAVSLCRSKTRNLKEFTKKADIIISCVGLPNLIKRDMVKKGVVVIDAGINLINGKTVGDVEFESVSKKASFITPVPGGVGPVTIVSLLENLLDLINGTY